MENYPKVIRRRKNETIDSCDKFDRGVGNSRCLRDSSTSTGAGSTHSDAA
jgi:hypothetical protein